ncbi:MAG: Rrf2 family transcriptional regulator [Thermodesulfobacteriota bacterium]|nr:Rrf2 family transcriptional regulator [Thermodesulfobacteriota bacterium]
MKLSTRSRYGARMLCEIAKNHDIGPVQTRDIARSQDISIKYLEQLIIPLKEANVIVSFRGPKGGHMLRRPPEEITIGEIVRILEGEGGLTRCVQDPDVCDRSKDCKTRYVWKMATDAMFEKLDSVTLRQLIRNSDTLRCSDK